MVRNSAKFVSYKDLKKVCADLKAVYAAVAEENASAILIYKKYDILEGWDEEYFGR